jgi:hypothetical protein
MSEHRIRLVNGPFDGLEVEDDPKAEILWVYQNRYGKTVTARAGGMRRTPIMAAYVVLPGRAEAMHGMS